MNPTFSASFRVANQSDEISQETLCAFCDLSNWHIINPALIPTPANFGVTACIFIAPNRSRFVVHLIELLLAVEHKFTLEGKFITLKNPVTALPKEQGVTTYLINLPGTETRLYNLKLGIKRYVGDHSETFPVLYSNWFASRRNEEARIVFQDIKRASLSVQQTSSFNSSSSSNQSTVQEVTFSRRSDAKAVIRDQEFVFSTTVFLSNGRSRSLKTFLPCHFISNFVHGKLPPREYTLSGSLSTSTSCILDEPIPTKDVEISSSVSESFLNKKQLIVVYKVILNNGTLFNVKTKYSTDKLHQYLMKKFLNEISSSNTSRKNYQFF